MNWQELNIALKLQRKYSKRIRALAPSGANGDQVSVVYVSGDDNKSELKTRTYTLDEQGELKEVV